MPLFGDLSERTRVEWMVSFCDISECLSVSVHAIIIIFDNTRRCGPLALYVAPVLELVSGVGSTYKRTERQLYV